MDLNEIEYKLKTVDWHNVDLIKVKKKFSEISTSTYYFEGHKVYDECITDDGKKLVECVRKNRCYGISEVVRGNSANIDQFYVRTNISDTIQRENVIGFLSSNFQLNESQIEVLDILRNIESIVDFSGDYKSMYFVGYAKEKNSAYIDRIRFYFRCKSDKTSEKECIRYLNKFAVFRCDKTFEYVKEMVINDKANFTVVGVEFDRCGNYKLKYYLGSVSRDEQILEAIRESKIDDKFQNFIRRVCKICDDNEEVSVSLIQISAGFDKEYSIDVYFETKTRFSEKFYSLSDGIICRDIGGIYFLVDIHEKNYYDSKKILKINHIGNIIVEFMSENKVCTIEGIVSYVKAQILNYNPEMYQMICKDCKEFIQYLVNEGYACEVE